MGETTSFDHVDHRFVRLYTACEPDMLSQSHCDHDASVWVPPSHHLFAYENLKMLLIFNRSSGYALCQIVVLSGFSGYQVFVQSFRSIWTLLDSDTGAI